MIKEGSKCDFRILPVSSLRVTEYQVRHPERLQHYVDLLLANPNDAPGFILVKAMSNSETGYQILDGHHRFVAHIMTGRTQALCIVVEEPSDTRTDDQRDLEELRAKLSAPPRVDAIVPGNSYLSEAYRQEEANRWRAKFVSELEVHWQNSENRAVVRGDDNQLGHILDRLL